MPRADGVDLGNTSGPWWVSAGGIFVGILGVVGPLLFQRWKDRDAAKPPPAGLNAPVVATITETTRPHGMSGVQLSAMLQTVDLLSDNVAALREELTSARAEIEILKRHDSQKQWALDEAIRLYIHAEGKPPRLVPEYLLPYITPKPAAP
jgi:hypothetical protein